MFPINKLLKLQNWLRNSSKNKIIAANNCHRLHSLRSERRARDNAIPHDYLFVNEREQLRNQIPQMYTELQKHFLARGRQLI